MDKIERHKIKLCFEMHALGEISFSCKISERGDTPLSETPFKYMYVSDFL